MNIKLLLEAQQEKNKSLVLDPNLDVYKIFARKHLQMHTKLSALADATKCYQYWVGENESIDNEEVFKKYLCCLGQILTLGLDREYVTINEIQVESTSDCLSDQFLHIYIDVNDLIISPSEDHFVTLLEDFFTLGISLGYSLEKIQETFLSLI